MEVTKRVALAHVPWRSGKGREECAGAGDGDDMTSCGRAVEGPVEEEEEVGVASRAIRAAAEAILPDERWSMNIRGLW